MKTFITFLTLFCLQSAFAQDYTELNSRDLGLSKATGEITSIGPICPQIPGRLSCMAYGSKVVVKVGLNGCLDRLGGFFSKFESVDGKGVLYFSAINIATKESSTVRCFQQASQTVTIYVPYMGDIELVNLNYTGIANK